MRYNKSMDKDKLIASLQKTIELQSKQIEAQTEQLKQQALLLKKMDAQLDKLLRQLYGKKSEKQKGDDDNPPPTGNTKATDTDSACPADNQVKRPKRQKPPEHLERIDVIHDLPLHEKCCEHCQSELRCFSQVESEQIEVIPARLVVKRHIRYKYACGCGLGGVKMAAMPNQPIDKGLPGPGLLADVLINKYQDAMPLYRQMMRFARHGYSCSDSTLGDWVRESTFLLQPIVERMKQELMSARKIHTDDTPVSVLGKGKTRTGRLWVYLTGLGSQNKMCIYDYTTSRASSGPVAFLSDYSGYLQADAYSGYDVLYREQDITEVGCFAHARRKFYDVMLAAKGASHAEDIVKLIGKLYEVEAYCKNQTIDERYHYRKRFSKPILKVLKRKINNLYKRAVSKTPFYQALEYARNHWQALTRYLADGILSIDNNSAERAIKPVVIGRKNWLFAGSDEGGKRAAIAYSIIETCKMNGINTFNYLRDVLAKIPNTLHKDLHMLLPYNWKSSHN